MVDLLQQNNDYVRETPATPTSDNGLGGLLASRESLDFFRNLRTREQSTGFISFSPLPGQEDVNPAFALAGQERTDYSTAVAGQCPDGRCFFPPFIPPQPETFVPPTPTDTALETAPLRRPSDAVTQARNECIEALLRQNPGATRAEIEALCNRFEARMMRLGQTRSIARGSADQGYAGIDNILINSYRSLGNLASQPTGQPGELYDQPTRARRALNLLYYAANTDDHDQGVPGRPGGRFGEGGSNGSCWNQAGRILGFISRPDRMIDYASQLMLTGEFTARVGNPPYSFRLTNEQRRNLQITDGMPEASWTIQNARGTNTRSPVGLLFDRSMSYMLGRAHEHGGTYDEIRTAMRRITGLTVPFAPHMSDSQRRQALMEWGGYIVYSPGTGRGDGHMRTNQLVHREDGWHVLEDNQHGAGMDRLGARIPGLTAWLRSRTPETMPRSVMPCQPGELFQPRRDSPCGPYPIRIPGVDGVLDEFEIPQRTRQIIVGLLRLILSRCFGRRGSSGPFLCR